MSKRVLGTFTDNQKFQPIVLYVAYENTPGHFKVKMMNAQSSSDYFIGRTIESGRIVGEAMAIQLFPNLIGEYKLDQESQEEPAQGDQISSLSDLYEKAKDQVFKISPKPDDQDTADLLTILREIRDMSAQAIMRRPTVEA